MQPDLKYVASLPLHHEGDCYLRGVTPDFRLFVEEVYGDEDWMAQHMLRFDGAVLATADENFGRSEGFSALPLPQDLSGPAPVRQTLHLNFTGPRHRGMREPERIGDVIRPLSVQDKIAFIRHLGLDVPLPLILGLAESTVLAEAVVMSPDIGLVCRRCRLAYALPEPRLDAAHLPYNYDTFVFYVAHLYNWASDDELSADQLFAGIPPIKLNRPMDCMVAHRHVFIADGGAAGRISAVHIWRMEREERGGL